LSRGATTSHQDDEHRAPLVPLVWPVVALPLIMLMQLHVQHQVGDDEKSLVIIWLQTELIGKVTAMVIACIERKPVQLGIGEEL
jgi:hypothetical protein